MKKKEKKPDYIPRPPIVAVLGHVDHGKTTLLDTIRKTNVVKGEAGGITQAIGAYQVEIPSEKGEEKSQKITFIDTPGHEAFSKMRGRGASVADIAVLVVAANDSVKPQTEESIKMIKEAGIPMIVAINKIDLPDTKIEKVKKDLARVGVQLEGFGGDVPVQQISAKQGSGVQELLSLIVLVSQMREISGDPDGVFESVVIETKVDKGKGMTATIIVKSGTLKISDALYLGNVQVAKVRAMFDENGNKVDKAYPSQPVETIGFISLPVIGSVLTATATGLNKENQNTVKTEKIKDQIPDFLKPIKEGKEKLFVVLKADTAGSLEAITESINPQIEIISRGVGAVTEADVLHAKASGAFVIGFNVKLLPAVEKLAQTEKIVVRTYKIIYELFDELNEAVSGIKEILHEERDLGNGRVIAEFPFDDVKIAGTKVIQGRLSRGDSVKIMRGEELVARSKIKSIRRGKEEVSKVELGSDCGILFDQKVDFLVGDVIIAFTL